MNSLYQPQLVQPVNWSTVPPKAKPISCFVITLDSSMPPVKFSEDLTCHPFVGQRVTDDMFKLVSTRVQQNLLQGTSLWGADFTNNISLSIAYNHVQLWRRLAAAPSEADMLILEDDIVPDERALLLYGKIRDSGALPKQNCI